MMVVVDLIILDGLEAKEDIDVGLNDQGYTVKSAIDQAFSIRMLP